MAEFVKCDTLNVSGGPQTAAIGIPRLCGVEKNIGLEHRRPRITVISYCQRVGTEALSEHGVGESH